MSNEYTEAAAEFIYDEVVELDMETMKAELRSLWQPYGLNSDFKGVALEQVQNMLVDARLEQDVDRYNDRCNC
jgi:hypothetical protein